MIQMVSAANQESGFKLSDSFNLIGTYVLYLGGAPSSLAALMTGKLIASGSESRSRTKSWTKAEERCFSFRWHRRKGDKKPIFNGASKGLRMGSFSAPTSFTKWILQPERTFGGFTNEMQHLRSDRSSLSTCSFRSIAGFQRGSHVCN